MNMVNKSKFYKKQSPEQMKETETFNKKTYSKQIKELKFLIETKRADDFTTEMYVALIAGRKITPKMMPGQEKMIMEYYQKNPSATDSLRGTIYENKIIESIKNKAKITKKEITKEEAEKILKSDHEHSHDHKQGDSHKNTKVKKTSTETKKIKPKKAKSISKKSSKLKKVSKK